MWCVNNRIIPNRLQPNHNQRHKKNNNLSNKTGFINVVLPPFKGGKDISDLYKVLSNKEKFKQLILKLFV